MIDDDGALSYRRLQSCTESLAAALVYRHGVGPGHAVGILCRNRRGFMRALFAAASVGADVVLLNIDFRADALATALGAHRIQTVICDDEFADRVHAADEAVAVVDPAARDIDERGPRPKAEPPGRIVLLKSGTTGTPRVCRAHPASLRHCVSESPFSTGSGCALEAESPCRCLYFTRWGSRW